jgi:diguanylate cyclase (GGDEF)-like protein
LLDVDRFGGLVEKAGTRMGDRILASLGRYLEQLALSESELDRVFRYSGQQYLVFFTDTGPRTAGSRADRMRQAVEATTFQGQPDSYTLTLRLGVVEVGPEEDTQAVFNRLSNLVDAAKRAGRNRTCVDEGRGASIVRPEPYDIKARVINLE